MPSRAQSLPWTRRAVVVGLLLAGAGPALSGVLIERTLAFANKKPVLLTDVTLTRVLLGLDEADALERTIDQTLMFEEASRLLNEPFADQAVAEATQALEEKAGAGFGQAALRRKARTELAIASYIEARLKPLVRVGDDEVRQLFNERVIREPNPPVFSDVAQPIREALEAQSLDQKIEEWVASLRMRAVIRRPPPRR